MTDASMLCRTMGKHDKKIGFFFLGTGANLIRGETSLYPAAIKIDKFEKFKGVVVKDEQSSSSREMTSGQHDGR